MTNSKANTTPNASLKILIIYLLSSFFSALLFSVLAVRARKKGNTGFGWVFLSLCCIALFGIIGYSLVKTSSPSHDAGYYYLGISTLFANALALFISFLTLFIKR